MNDFDRLTLYSIIGIFGVFLAVLLIVPSGFTGEATLREKFSSPYKIVGECTTKQNTCPPTAFCAANLMKSPESKLKGIYRGACILKYDPGHLCRRDEQCKSNECINVQELPQLAMRLSGVRGLRAPQIGGCA